MFKNIHNLLPSLEIFRWTSAERRKATELALEAEAYVHQLNGLTTTLEDGELISILQSTCLLLQRLVEQAELLQPPSYSSNEGELTLIRVMSPPPTETTSTPSVESEPELSTTLEELIKLRDWILLAKNNQAEGSLEALSAIYQKLGQILEQEGVIGIEETGLFNCDRQQVIATQVTSDPEKDDCICDTVRPGYLFHGELIRPQEAIVYIFQPASDR